MQATHNAQGWHVTNWGLWGWIETGIKGVGITAGWIAGLMALSAPGDLHLLNNPELGALILMTLLTLFYLVPVALRFQQREIISVIFALANFTAHLGTLFALLLTPDQTLLPLVFGVFIVLGELAKQRFLAASGYTEAGQTSSGMVNFSRGISAAYALLVLFLLI